VKEQEKFRLILIGTFEHDGEELKHVFPITLHLLFKKKSEYKT